MTILGKRVLKSFVFNAKFAVALRAISLYISDIFPQGSATKEGLPESAFCRIAISNGSYPNNSNLFFLDIAMPPPSPKIASV